MIRFMVVALRLLIVSVLVLLASLPLASVIGLGPAEFWLLPGAFAVGYALVALWRRRG